jgi:hypothetical protein
MTTSTSLDRTEPDKTGHISNPRHSQAIDLLLTGMNDREVAAAVNVRRQTVCEWRHDPAFQAQLDSRRRELWAPYIERLQSLLPRAVESIERQMLGSRDLKLAFRLIDLLGLGDACRANLGPAPPPIHEPVVSSADWKRDQDANRAIADTYVRDLLRATAQSGSEDEEP